MANIRRKSQENYKAAHLLVSNNMFASSIHCAYYACFQFSKFVLDACSNLDYYTQEEESKNMQQSSHEYIIRRMNEELSYIDYQAQIDYQSNMNRLKRLRKKADYSNNEITPTDARKALDFAEKTVNVLKHIYDIL